MGVGKSWWELVGVGEGALNSMEHPLPEAQSFFTTAISNYTSNSSELDNQIQFFPFQIGF